MEKSFIDRESMYTNEMARQRQEILDNFHPVKDAKRVVEKYCKDKK